jgi:hypothetical protein
MAGKTEIGALSVKLTAEASEFNKAVDKAGIRLSDLAKQGGQGFNVQSMMGGAGGLMSAMQNPMGSMGAAAGGPIGAGIGAATAAAREFAKTLDEIGHKFHETTKRAQELGISTNALVGLNIAAKDRTEEAQTALQHFERILGEAAGGSKEAQAKFEALGVSYADLEKMAPVEAFGKLNDKIKESGDVYSKAAAARQFYGRAGQQNMRLIEQGSAGIDKAMAQARAKNLVPDEGFTKAYEHYLESSRELDRSIEGAKNKVLSHLGEMWYEFRASVNEGLSGTIDEWFGLKDDPAATAKAQAAEKAAAIRAAAAAAQQRELASAGQALTAARELNQQLGRKAATEGMSAEAAMVYESRTKAAAASTQKLADAWNKAAAAQQGALEKQESIRRDSELGAQTKSLLAEIESPLERYQKKMGEINALWNTSRISAEQYARAVSKTVGDAEKALGIGADQLPPMLLRGSQAARTFDLQLDAANRQGSRSLEDRRKTVDGQMLAAQQNSTKALQELTRVMEERRQYTQEIGGLDSDAW